MNLLSHLFVLVFDTSAFANNLVKRQFERLAPSCQNEMKKYK